MSIRGRRLGVALVPGFVAFVALAGCVDPMTTTQQSVTVCGAGTTVRGMDVSSYDTVDWPTAHQAGIEFAFIRAGDGTQFVDPAFAASWTAAKAAGVIRGAYQFFRPNLDPIAQADRLLATMGPLAPGDLPPVIDVEVSGGRTKAQVTAAVRAWIGRVAAAVGRPPLVYTGAYAWIDLTGGSDVTTSPLWVAQYTAATCPDLPTPWPAWSFWQVSDTGSIAGVPGSNLDLDVFNGSREALRAFAGGGRDEPPDILSTRDGDGARTERAEDDNAIELGGCSASGHDCGLLVLILGALFAPRGRRFSDGYPSAPAEWLRSNRNARSQTRVKALIMIVASVVACLVLGAVLAVVTHRLAR